MRPVAGGGTRHKRLSWFNPTMLWNARNDILAKISDPVDAERARWVAGLSDDDLVVDLQLGDFAFLLMGDTGEGDFSQYAVLPPLLQQAEDAAFLFICSDVLYPIGDVNDYLVKFYAAYAPFPAPIFAIPGNHDWYDDLEGFMYHMCDREPDDRPPLSVTEDDHPLRRRIRAAVWRGTKPASEPSTELRKDFRHQRPAQQRSPYFVIDSEHLRIVCIDTGIRGGLDAEQGAWLRRVSADHRPKVLLTGKPIWVDGKLDPCPIAGGGTVDAIVTDPDFRYVAAIGGDVHNYQRYPVDCGGRTIQYIVSGGGGAFMHETQSIPKMTGRPCAEADFKCYPLRRDSLAVYSRLMDDRLHGGGRLVLTDGQAARYLGEKYDVPPLASRPIDETTPLTRTQRRAADVLTARHARSTFHKLVSPFLDWDDPPFYKHFLRLDVTADELVISCHAATGCAEDEAQPVIEDEVRVPLRRSEAQ